MERLGQNELTLLLGHVRSVLGELWGPSAQRTVQYPAVTPVYCIHTAVKLV